MPNVAHSTLTDPNIHEPKGVASATADSFYVATGAGTGSWKKRLFKVTATLTPAIVAANTTAEQTFTFTGVVLATDTVIGVSKPTAQAGLGIVGWRVSADNTIGITFSNNTAAGITPTAAQTYTAIIYRD
jgi:hypothetical protein